MACLRTDSHITRPLLTPVEGPSGRAHVFFTLDSRAQHSISSGLIEGILCGTLALLVRYAETRNSQAQRMLSMLELHNLPSLGHRRGA